MTSKLTKYGMMIIAAVLLVGVVFAGAASASISTAQDLSDAFNGWTSGSATWSGNTVTLQTDVLNIDDYLIFENDDSPIILDLAGHNITSDGDDHCFVEIGDDISGNFTISDSIGKGTISGFHTNDWWGACVYVDAGTFIMTGGNITNCTSGSGGGAIDSFGTLILSGDATISYCNAPYGGAVYVEAGTFNMTNDASISYCKATERGGAVYVNSGTFNMTDDASISYCNATMYGGAVYVNGNAEFTMSGDASIEHCNATSYGGAVFVDGDGTFTMTGDASIEHCNVTVTSSWNGGGAVYVDEGTFNMDGGSISYCNAIGTSQNSGGGAVYNDEGTFNMNGGSISYCTADYYGGGVCNYALFKVSGSATIMGNTASGVANNVYTDGGLNLVGDFTGRIGIIYPAPDAEPVEFGTSESAEFTGAENFVADVKYDGYTYVGKINTSDNNKLYWTLGHIVTFEPMNGEDNWDKPVEDNTAVAQPENPEKKGYTFSGWYNGDSKWDFNTNVTEDMTLTAKWQKIAQKKSSGQSGSTIILTETPTPIATSAPVATSAPADVPTINPSVKPTTQQTQASPAPFVGLLAGLGAAAVLIRLRK